MFDDKVATARFLYAWSQHYGVSDDIIREAMKPTLTTEQIVALKDKWVAALRSGEYSQARAALKDSEGNFCCLGVLCDIMAKDKLIDGQFVPSPDHEMNVVFKINGDEENDPTEDDEVLPYKVGTMLGMKLDGEFIYKDEADGETTFETLAELNDDGKTFEEIADIIDERLPILMRLHPAAGINIPSDISILPNNGVNNA